MEFTLNNNKFKTGDKIKLINLANSEIFDAEIGNEKIYSSNNCFAFELNQSFVNNSSNIIEEKYKYEAEHDYLSSIFLFMHDVDLEGYSLDIEHHFKNFLWSRFKDLYKYLCFKSKLLSKYSEIKRSEKQGYVELHTKDGKKKVEIKIGRLIRKLSNEYNEIISKNSSNTKIELKDSLIEELHNTWISHHQSNMQYEILKGDDILKAYTKDNQVESKGGTLRNSCMNDKHNFLEMYTKNPEQISLIAFKFKNSDKFIGRALVWKAEDGKTYHDRIYFAEDWYEISFMDQCKELGYEKIYNINKNVTIKLDNLKFEKYPYCDTFCFASFEKAIVKNYNYINYDATFDRELRDQYGGSSRIRLN